MQHLDRWGKLTSDLPPNELAEQILEEAGYIEMWKQEKSIEAQGRLENLRELFRALGEFEHITEFLEHVGLVTDMDAVDQEDLVSIMTLHAAKGLEFNTVFLTGWEEGLFPHQRALDESGASGLEEERRLAYVGITRAKALLYISHAANRRMYNQWQSSIPSRFLQELPEEHLDYLDGGVGSPNRAQGPALFQKEVEHIFSTRTSSNTSFKTSSKTATRKDNWSGKRVFHMKFGYGTVLSAQGKNLDISFEKAGRKKVMADYVETC